MHLLSNVWDACKGPPRIGLASYFSLCLQSETAPERCYEDQLHNVFFTVSHFVQVHFITVVLQGRTDAELIFVRA